MPCYDPPPTADDIARWRSRDDETWYKLTPQKDIEQWLCDALRGSPAHPDCLRWWELHKKYHDKKR